MEKFYDKGDIFGIYAFESPGTWVVHWIAYSVLVTRSGD